MVDRSDLRSWRIEDGKRVGESSDLLQTTKPNRETAGAETPRPDRPRAEEYSLADASAPGWRLTLRTPAWRPPTDVYETEDFLMVRVEVAGMRENDFSLELDGRYLTIRGVRQDVAERRAYHQMEIRFGEFSVELELPVAVIGEEVKAVYSNGFLRVFLPKARNQSISVEQ